MQLTSYIGLIQMWQIDFLTNPLYNEYLAFRAHFNLIYHHVSPLRGAERSDKLLLNMDVLQDRQTERGKERKGESLGFIETVFKQACCSEEIRPYGGARSQSSDGLVTASQSSLNHSSEQNQPVDPELDLLTYRTNWQKGSLSWAPILWFPTTPVPACLRQGLVLVKLAFSSYAIGNERFPTQALEASSFSSTKLTVWDVEYQSGIDFQANTSSIPVKVHILL